MSDIALDVTTGDLDLTGAQFNLVEGGNAIAQEIRIGLRFFRGEWFLDIRVGLPYFTDIFVKNPDENVLRALFQRELRTVPGVKSIDQITCTLNHQTRELSVSFKVSTDLDKTFDVTEAFVLL